MSENEKYNEFSVKIDLTSETMQGAVKQKVVHMLDQISDRIEKEGLKDFAIKDGDTEIGVVRFYLDPMEALRQQEAEKSKDQEEAQQEQVAADLAPQSEASEETGEEFDQQQMVG